MTLVVCLRGVDGLVFGADSRGIVGDVMKLSAMKDSEQKLFQLSKYAGAASYGYGDIGSQLMFEVVQALSQDQISDITPVIDRTSEIIRKTYNQWFSGFPIEKRSVVGFLLGGMDRLPEANSEMKICGLDSRHNFAPELVTSNFEARGFPYYAIYLLKRFHDPKLRRESLLRLAAYVIAETATNDAKVGGPIRLAEISLEEGFKSVDDNRIQEILKQNEKMNQKMKNLFVDSSPEDRNE